MLHKETVEPRTLELLKRLQDEPLLQTFNLVGGTALALRLGHRKSIDLDLFTREEFDLEELKAMLMENYELKVSYERNQTLKGFIDGVMIDCIRFNYPHLQAPDIVEGVRLESIPDIIAMKLSAIAQNGTRVKDFIDIATLSTRYSLDGMLEFYSLKFPNANVLMPVKALTFFDEIDFNESVVMTSGKFDWKRIAKRLNEMMRNSKKVFTTIP